MTFSEKDFYKNISSAFPITVIITVYSVTLGFAYLYGYWANFNIDINIVLSMLSPLDMVKSFIIPFLTASFLFITQIFNLISSDALYSPEQKLVSMKNKYNRLLNISQILVVLLIVYYGYKSISQNSEFDNTLFYSYSFCLFMSININIIFSRKDFISTRRVSLFLSILLYLPALCLNVGHYQGTPILSERSLVMKDNSTCSSDSSDTFILLGIYGQKGLSYSVKNKRICIFNSENQSYLNNTIPARPVK